MNEHYIEEPNLSLAWAKAVKQVSAPGCDEVGPLIVSVTGFDSAGDFAEETRIRTALDVILAEQRKQTVETVASTIFPKSMWNPDAPRKQLFERYLRIAPKLHRTAKNRGGIYFERMIAAGPQRDKNQLDFALGAYLARTGVRRSVLQVGVFDPAQDHSTAARRGFPCLQHVTFAPGKDGLCVNAFYASQYLVERGYGNYVGLCRLGQFAAHELGLPLVRMTCFTGIATTREVPKGRLREVLAVINEVLAAADAQEAL